MGTSGQPTTGFFYLMTSALAMVPVDRLRSSLHDDEYYRIDSAIWRHGQWFSHKRAATVYLGFTLG